MQLSSTKQPKTWRIRSNNKSKSWAFTTSSLFLLISASWKKESSWYSKGSNISISPIPSKPLVKSSASSQYSEWPKICHSFENGWLIMPILASLVFSFMIMKEQLEMIMANLQLMRPNMESSSAVLGLQKKRRLQCSIRYGRISSNKSYTFRGSL